MKLQRNPFNKGLVSTEKMHSVKINASVIDAYARPCRDGFYFDRTKRENVVEETLGLLWPQGVWSPECN